MWMTLPHYQILLQAVGSSLYLVPLLLYFSLSLSLSLLSLSLTHTNTHTHAQTLQGLAGSSAIITATTNCLMHFFGLTEKVRLFVMSIMCNCTIGREEGSR